MIHRAGYPCVPFDQCPICLAKHKKQREAFRNNQGGNVPTARPMYAEDWLPMFEELQKNRFLAERVAYHLAHGCDTPEKARELALVEWRVGVLGEKS